MATTSFTTTGPEDARIVAAVGKILRLGRNATQAEVKTFVVSLLVQAIQGQEQSDKAGSITGPDAITPT